MCRVFSWECLNLFFELLVNLHLILFLLLFGSLSLVSSKLLSFKSCDMFSFLTVQLSDNVDSLPSVNLIEIFVISIVFEDSSYCFFVKFSKICICSRHWITSLHISWSCFRFDVCVLRHFERKLEIWVSSSVLGWIPDSFDNQHSTWLGDLNKALWEVPRSAKYLFLDELGDSFERNIFVFVDKFVGSVRDFVRISYLNDTLFS